jgi:hypothetical protein
LCLKPSALSQLFFVVPDLSVISKLFVLPGGNLRGAFSSVIPRIESGSLAITAITRLLQTLGLAFDRSAFIAEKSEACIRTSSLNALFPISYQTLATCRTTFASARASYWLAWK